MFQNLKKKIHGLGANSPGLRGAAPAGGDGLRREETDGQSKEAALTEGESSSRKVQDVVDVSSGETVTPVPLARSDVGRDPESLMDSTEATSKHVTTSETSSTAQVSSVTEEAQTQKPSFVSFSLEDLDNSVDTQNKDLEDVTTLDLDNLQRCYFRLQDQSNLYKSHLRQAAAAYRKIETEKEQLQVNFSQASEKHRRQLSELKEQILLDSHAKRDLENNYALMLDEKDEMIQVLRMKIRLLKDGNSDEAKNSSLDPPAQEQAVVGEANADASETQLKEKVRRLELLLTRCKDTIRLNKEKIQQLGLDRDAMAKLAQEKTDELEKFKEQSDKTVLDLQKMLTVTEDKLKTQCSDDQSKSGRAVEVDRVIQLEDQNKSLQEKVIKLEKSGQEQLDKSREIIRQLKEQKRQLQEKVKDYEDLGHKSVQDIADREVEKDEEKQKLEIRIKEVFEENAKNKAEFEKKLQDLTSQHSRVVDDFKEKLLAEEKKVVELEEKYQTKVSVLVLENKTLTETRENVEADLLAKTEEVNALTQTNFELEKRLKAVLDNEEQDELRKRVAELDRMVEKWKLDFEDQGKRFVEERNSLQGRVRELEALVDNQKEMFGKEADLVKTTVEEEQSRELISKMKEYENEIELLRREIEVKNSHVIEERKDIPVAGISLTNQTRQSTECATQISEKLIDVDGGEQKIIGELKKESNLTLLESEQINFQTAVEPETEADLIKIDAPHDITERLEIENAKLKELNKRLMDENENSNSLISDFEKTILVLTADADTQQQELGRRLASSTEIIAQLEQRISGSMERENQLNMDLETVKIENEQNLTAQNRQIISLNETIEKLRNSERVLQDAIETSDQKIKTLQDTISKNKFASENEEIATLKSLVDRLKISEQTLETTNASLNEELETLRESVGNLSNSEKMLKDKNKSQSDEINSLEMTLEQLRSSEKNVKDANALQIEEIASLNKIIEGLKSSEMILRDTNASKIDELISCKAIIEQLQTSEETSKEIITSQNEEINSLKAVVDQLKTTEATLLDKNSLQIQEITSLKDLVDQEKSAGKILSDANALQTEEINSLKKIVDQMKISEQELSEKVTSRNEELDCHKESIAQLMNSEKALKETIVLQNEEISSLKETVDEVKISRAALSETACARNEEISSLKIIIEQIKSSEQTWKDACNAQSEEISSLRATIERLRRSESSLRETVASKNEELNLLNSWIPLHSFYPTVDNVQKSVKKQNHFKIEVEEFLDPDGLTLFKVKESSATTGELTTEQDLANEMETEEVIKRLEAEIELLSMRLHEKEKLQRQFDIEKQVLQEKLDAMENFDDSDHKAEMDLRLELDHLEEKAQHSLEIISFMEQVKCLEEEIVLMKQAYVRSPLSASAMVSPSVGFFAKSGLSQSDRNTDRIEKQKERVEGRADESDSCEEKFEIAEEKREMIVAEKTEDTEKSANELAIKQSVDRTVLSDLKQTSNLNNDSDENLLELGRDIQEMEIKSTEEKEKSNRMPLELFEDMEVFHYQDASRSVVDSDFCHSVSRCDLDSNQNHFERDKIKNAFDENAEIKNEKIQDTIKLYESRISELEQTQATLQDDLTILLEKLSAVTERCSKAEKDAEHYRRLTLEKNGNGLGFTSELNSENERKMQVDEVTELKSKLEESRTELEHLRQKLQRLEEQEQLQSAKQSDSCLSFDSTSLPAEKNALEIAEVSNSSVSSNLETFGLKKDVFVPDIGAAATVHVSSAESAKESKLKVSKNGLKTEKGEDTGFQLNSGSSDTVGFADSSVVDGAETAQLKRHFESVLSEVRKTYEEETESLKLRNEKSVQVYETRIADLEQASSMLQEDVTILMEKLNAVKEQSAEADRMMLHYKQMVQDFESRGFHTDTNRELEQELSKSKEEIAFLREEIKRCETKSTQEDGGIAQSIIRKNVGEMHSGVDIRSPRSENEEKQTSETVTNLLPTIADHHLVLEFNRNSLSQANFVDQSVGDVKLSDALFKQECFDTSVQYQDSDEITKLKLEFKSELKKCAMENSRLKEIQKELIHEVNSLKSSIQTSMYNDAKLFVSEPTELEYLRHILYKYMLGMETKTLAKVICTVVKFSPDETRKVLEREDARSKLFPSGSR